MTTTRVAIPITDFLLDEVTALRADLAATEQALAEVHAWAHRVANALTELGSRTSGYSEELHALHRLAARNVEQVRELAANGDVTEVKTVIRDLADGRIESVITTKAPNASP